MSKYTLLQAKTLTTQKVRLTELIAANPSYFLEQLPLRFAAEKNQHNYARCEFIAECAALFIYAKEHPEVYEDMADDEYFRKSRQKKIDPATSKWIVYHMMRPESKSSRSTAGKYKAIIDDQLAKSTPVDEIARVIHGQGGIEKSYKVAGGRTSHGKKEKLSTKADIVHDISAFSDTMTENDEDGSDVEPINERSTSIRPKKTSHKKARSASQARLISDSSQSDLDDEPLEVEGSTERKLRVLTMKKGDKAVMKIEHMGKDGNGRDRIVTYSVKRRQ